MNCSCYCCIGTKDCTPLYVASISLVSTLPQDNVASINTTQLGMEPGTRIDCQEELCSRVFKQDVHPSITVCGDALFTQGRVVAQVDTVAHSPVIYLLSTMNQSLVSRQQSSTSTFIGTPLASVTVETDSHRIPVEPFIAFGAVVFVGSLLIIRYKTRKNKKVWAQKRSKRRVFDMETPRPPQEAVRITRLSTLPRSQNPAIEAIDPADNLDLPIQALHTEIAHDSLGPVPIHITTKKGAIVQRQEHNQQEC